MDRFIARANIDHYLDLLSNGSLAPDKRATVIRLLIAEADKLSHDLEHLEFAETRAANGRDRLNDVRCLRDAAHPANRAQAERLVANFEAIQQLLDEFCHRLRTRVNSPL
jgi:hypothetical protein